MAKPMILLHATNPQDAAKIAMTGFLPSMKGRLGGNCSYFVEPKDLSVAVSISDLRSEGKALAIMWCEVPVQPSEIKDLGAEMDKTGSWQKTHKVAKGIHPGWKGSVLPPFTEYAVRDVRSIRVVRIDFSDATFGDLPKLTVGVQGKCNAQGDVSKCSWDTWVIPSRVPKIAPGFEF